MTMSGSRKMKRIWRMPIGSDAAAHRNRSFRASRLILPRPRERFIFPHRLKVRQAGKTGALACHILLKQVSTRKRKPPLAGKGQRRFPERAASFGQESRRLKGG